MAYLKKLDFLIDDSDLYAVLVNRLQTSDENLIKERSEINENTLKWYFEEIYLKTAMPFAMLDKLFKSANVLINKDNDGKFIYFNSNIYDL